MQDQKGAIPLLLLVAAIGIIGVLGVVKIAPFRDQLLSGIFPKQSSQAAVDEWTQEGHDAQRTGVTSEEPSTPWTFKWAFNGPDNNGGAGGHIQDAPVEARVITGGAHVYSPLGPKGLFALRKTNGSVAWNRTETSFNATPAYDPASQILIAGGADGKVYKIDADTGAILGTYNAGSPVNKAILLAGNHAFGLSDNGVLHKIVLPTMSSVWTYSANSAPHTLPSYSPSRDVIVFATADLNVHAVNNSNGSQKWKVKPTPNSPGFPNEFKYSWPVIAEKHGVVLLRMQLDHNSNLLHAPGFNYSNPDQDVNRAWLEANPQEQNLFALNLDDGSKKFTPVVGYGSTEDLISGAAYGRLGTLPIVKVYPDGTEVVYMIFRNGQSTPPDYRWDSHMGEMVLDDTTIPGLKAGDFRFVRMNSLNGYGGNSYTFITDEQTPISMAGNTLFNAHWGASTSMRITDRSANKGLTYSNPIEAIKNPSVVRSQVSCANFNPTTHFTTCHLGYFTNNGRFFEGPGFWGYWDVVDPPGWRTGIAPAPGDAYSAGLLPRYTLVSDGLMIVEGNGGEILTFSHSGSTSQPSPSIIPTTTPSPVASVSAAPSSSPSSSPVSSTTPGVSEVVDSTDSRISFNGWFPTTANSNMYGGSERIGEFGGDNFAFNFTGNAISLVYTQNTDRGQAAVYIDNVLIENLDQYGTLEYQKEKTYPLTQGNHTLKITVSRTKQSASTGFSIGVDALRVSQQTPSPVPTPSASQSPAKAGDIDGNNKVDIFDYNILLTDFGKTGNLPADIDKDGKVDIFDYNILLTNFGT